jgi:hypothetical protein
MSDDIIPIDDLSDEELNEIYEEALDRLTRAYADKLAKDHDPAGADPGLSDRIYTELISTPEYKETFLDSITREADASQKAVLDTTVMNSVAKALRAVLTHI